MQPSEPFRVYAAESAPSWPHSVVKNAPITSGMQAIQKRVTYMG
jgi:hypothetical protein